MLKTNLLASQDCNAMKIEFFWRVHNRFNRSHEKEKKCKNTLYKFELFYFIESTKEDYKIINTKERFDTNTSSY